MSINTKTEKPAVKTENPEAASRQFNAEPPAVISMEFTRAELETISSGILSLIEKTTQAKILVPDGKVHASIDEYYTKLQALNIRICRCR